MSVPQTPKQRREAYEQWKQSLQAALPRLHAEIVAQEVAQWVHDHCFRISDHQAAALFCRRDEAGRLHVEVE